jgi:hypothetical protein
MLMKTRSFRPKKLVLSAALAARIDNWQQPINPMFSLACAIAFLESPLSVDPFLPAANYFFLLQQVFNGCSAEKFTPELVCYTKPYETLMEQWRPSAFSSEAIAIS